MKKLPALVIALGFVSLFTDVASDMMIPVLPVFLTATLGLSATFFGLIEGIADMVAAVLKGAGGVWSDRNGGERKKWLVGGYTLSAMSRPFIALASGPGLVIALRSLDRVGKGLRTAPRDALITAAVDEGVRGRAFGFHRAMDHTGALIGGLLASGLLAWGLSEREVIGWTIVPGLAAILTVSLAVREKAAVAAPRDRRKPDLPALVPGLRRFLPVAGAFALANSSDAFLLLKARETGVSAALLPLLWAWIHVARIAANLAGGAMADRFGARRTVAAGWLCYGVVYALVACAAKPWQVWIVLGIYGIYNGLTEGGEKLIVSQLSRQESQGTAFGAFHFVTGILALPASLLTGLLWDHYGSGIALGACAVIAVLAAAWLSMSGNALTSAAGTHGRDSDS